MILFSFLAVSTLPKNNTGGLIMIIVARRFGQLGNRLILSSHLIAAAREYGVGFANPSFAEYAHLFQGTANDLWCRFPSESNSSRIPIYRQRRLLEKFVECIEKSFWSAHLRKFPYHLRRLQDGDTCDLAGDEFADEVRGGRSILISGWQYRSQTLLEKHGHEIRQHFQIVEKHRRIVDAVSGELHRDSDLVVGIHMRQGDYKFWRGGQFFYSSRQYAALMHSIVEQFPTRSIKFLLCTNGKFNQVDFKGLKVTTGPGHLVEDMYSLAETDFMVGPPSTYTEWASFYGQKPLFVMDSVDMQIDPKLVTGRVSA
jgi:hypothetical protein